MGIWLFAHKRNVQTNPFLPLGFAEYGSISIPNLLPSPCASDLIMRRKTSLTIEVLINI